MAMLPRALVHWVPVLQPLPGWQPLFQTNPWAQRSAPLWWCWQFSSQRCHLLGSPATAQQISQFLCSRHPALLLQALAQGFPPQPRCSGASRWHVGHSLPHRSVLFLSKSAPLWWWSLGSSPQCHLLWSPHSLPPQSCDQYLLPQFGWSPQVL